jgi:Na+-driven multidrug efflux pump
METTARRTRAAVAVALGLVGALALPALALAAEGESAPESPLTVGAALAIICVMAVVLFLFGLLGVRGAATDAKVEHDAKD